MSPDLKSWNKVDLETPLHHQAFGNGRFGVASYNGPLYMSEDGTDWVEAYPQSDMHILSLLFAHGAYYVLIIDRDPPNSGFALLRSKS